MLKTILKLLLSKVTPLVTNCDNSILSLGDYYDLFCGYYDVSPFSHCSKFLCVHGRNIDCDVVDILVINIEKKEFFVIDSTSAWNYQQGARLTWFAEDELIYNRYSEESDSYVSIIKNVKTLEERIIPYPVQTFFKDQFILSIDYCHLTDVGSEYGYKCQYLSNRRKDLIFYDTNTGEAEVLFSIDDCFHQLKNEYQTSRRAHINHFLINTTGDYFIFLFRFYEEGRRIDNLFGYCLKEKSIELLLENEVISHCSWRDDVEFVFWGIVDDVAGYYMFSIIDRKLILKVSTNQDGHPTFLTHNVILTDTYPNKFLQQELYTLDVETKNRKLICTKRHPAFYSIDRRCDFHPSVSKQIDRFQIDILDNGRRKVCIGMI
ncbi:MAG: hypothetical protein JXC36_07075 [Candidatus Atribacteria bacterium]|nr:hypothetical protein [Candidatus Atribacteria bacterium]